jgi:hypothetical protein
MPSLPLPNSNRIRLRILWSGDLRSLRGFALADQALRARPPACKSAEAQPEQSGGRRLGYDGCHEGFPGFLIEFPVSMRTTLHLRDLFRA